MNTSLSGWQDFFCQHGEEYLAERKGGEELPKRVYDPLRRVF